MKKCIKCWVFFNNNIKISCWPNVFSETGGKRMKMKEVDVLDKILCRRKGGDYSQTVRGLTFHGEHSDYKLWLSTVLTLTGQQDENTHYPVLVGLNVNNYVTIPKRLTMRQLSCARWSQCQYVTIPKRLTMRQPALVRHLAPCEQVPPERGWVWDGVVQPARVRGGSTPHSPRRDQ